MEIYRHCVMVLFITVVEWVHLYMISRFIFLATSMFYFLITRNATMYCSVTPAAYIEAPLPKPENLQNPFRQIVIWENYSGQFLLASRFLF